MTKGIPPQRIVLTGVINTQMLQSCFGPEAASYHDPEAWARLAVPGQ